MERISLRKPRHATSRTEGIIIFMLFVNYKIHAARQDVLEALLDTTGVESAENYDTSRGIPKFTVKENQDKIKIRCEMTGRATKDNGFLEGTYFTGRISERCGEARVRGVILTAPIYHFLLILAFAFFIWQCISVRGFSPIPVILLIFDIFMFKDEFRKQGLIKRYIFRSFKMTFAKIKNAKSKEDEKNDVS